MNIPYGEQEVSFDFELAEAVLAERLENITESIQPSLGYEVQLDGVQTPNPLVWGSLETYFDTMLDIENGASLTLDYDPLTDQLVLKSLQVETKSQSGPVIIHRTENGYIPLQTIDGATFIYGEDDVEIAGHKGTIIKSTFGSRILEEFGIANIPHNKSAQYQLWLSQILGSTRAWRLTESAELPLAVTDSATQSVIIKKETVVGQEMEDFFVSHSLTERIIQANPTGEGHLKNESVLELSGHIGESPLRHYLTESIVTPESLLYQDFDTDEEPKTSLPINEESYSRLKKKLEEVSLLKHKLSQLD